MLPLSEVQTAIYNALVPALSPVPIVDQAGPNQVYPYATLGESIAEKADTLDRQGVNVEMTVHVWSRQLGVQECQQIMAKAKDALHDSDLPVANCQWVSCRFTYAQTLRDPDGVTRHGILRFQVWTYQSGLTV